MLQVQTLAFWVMKQCSAWLVGTSLAEDHTASINMADSRSSMFLYHCFRGTDTKSDAYSIFFHFDIFILKS